MTPGIGLSQLLSHCPDRFLSPGRRGPNRLVYRGRLVARLVNHFTRNTGTRRHPRTTHPAVPEDCGYPAVLFADFNLSYLAGFFRVINDNESRDAPQRNDLLSKILIGLIWYIFHEDW